MDTVTQDTLITTPTILMTNNDDGNIYLTFLNNH